MDRNEFSSDGSTQVPGHNAGPANAADFAAANATDSQGFAGSGSTAGSMGSGSQSDGSTVSDRARNIAGSARDRLADVGSSARDRAGNLKNSLADALESGADRLRQRAGGQGGSLAGTTDTGSVALENEGRLTDVTRNVATGMQSSADWLRDADMDGLKLGIEKQVKEHPGRTLLIAVGLGYLIGKAFRK
jgi:hypothetical protein